MKYIIPHLVVTLALLSIKEPRSRVGRVRKNRVELLYNRVHE